MTDRISTGIKGVDKLVQGGFPKGSVVLVSGSPGTGKTIFGMQFLEDGLKKGEKCVYVTIEEPPAKIMAQAEQFGFFKKAPEMVSAKDIKYDIVTKKPEDLSEKIKLVLEKLKKNKPDRVVIDSISSLSIEDGIIARKVSRLLIEGLNDLGVTAVVTGEGLDGDYPDKVTPFLVDGVLIFNTVEIGPEIKRILNVIKMRETKVDLSKKAFDIKSKGIQILKDSDIFGEAV